MKRTPCKISSRSKENLAREFTELHEGLSPTSFSCDQFFPPVFPIRRMGRVVQIDYDKLTPDGKQWYYHPIVIRSRPLLGFDRHGTPVVYAGKIHVTTRGIEDVPPEKQHREHIPHTPKTLSVFGRLRQIRYQSETAQRVETWKPSRPIDLAHDEKGELHFLSSSSREGKMAHRRSHRKHHRGSSHRRNPVEFTGEKKSPFRAVIPTLAIGAGSAIAAGITDALLSKPNPTTGVPRLSGYKRAAAEVGVGLGLAVVGHVAKLPPVATLALGIGPVAVGSTTAYQTYKAQHALNNPPGGSTQNGQTNPNGGGHALMPGGLPQGYYGVPRAVCGVR